MSDVIYLDRDGNTQSEEWATTYFGPQDIHIPDVEEMWSAVLFAETADGTKRMTVRLVDDLGDGVAGVQVSAGQRDGDQHFSKITNEHGVAEFLMDDTWKYGPPEEPAHYAIAVTSGGGHSQVWNTAGLVRGQGRWLNPTFMLAGQGPPPDPDPDPDPEPEPPQGCTYVITATITVARG